MIRKAIAYMTRQRGSKRELLVFEHVGVEAGVQVPKGTVEPGEAIERAACREVREETGLTQLDGFQFIGAIVQPPFTESGESEECNFFGVIADNHVADEWIHSVGGKGEDEGMKFRYYWLPLPLEIELAGRQGDGLPLLSETIHE